MNQVKPSLREIKQFLQTGKLAVAGASRDPKKFGNQVFRQLQVHGFDLYPIHPEADNINGVSAYRTIAELPAEVKHLLIITPKKETEKMVEEAIAKNLDAIWIQQMSDTPSSIRMAREAGLLLICKECIFMWTDPVKGIHRFHKSIRKLFGTLPR